MTHRDHASKLESAADRIADVPLSDLQIMLRRAAIRLRNASAMMFDEDVEEALRSIASELSMSRGELVQHIIREWLETNAYLPVRTLEEDGEVDGTA